jgi:hypothetical protein
VGRWKTSSNSMPASLFQLPFADRSFVRVVGDLTQVRRRFWLDNVERLDVQPGEAPPF